jgi:hypothetical protein
VIASPSQSRPSADPEREHPRENRRTLVDPLSEVTTSECCVERGHQHICLIRPEGERWPDFQDVVPGTRPADQYTGVAIAFITALVRFRIFKLDPEQEPASADVIEG